MTTKKRRRRRDAKSDDATTSDAKPICDDAVRALRDSMTADGREVAIVTQHNHIVVHDIESRLHDSVASMWRAVGVQVRSGTMSLPTVEGRVVSIDELRRLRG